MAPLARRSHSRYFRDGALGSQRTAAPRFQLSSGECWNPASPDPAPPEKRGEGYRLAREALSSRVERLALSVYDARPEVLGTFDVVFWMPSARTWRRLVWSAGFDQVDEKARFSLRDRSSSFSVRHVVVHGRKAAAT